MKQIVSVSLLNFSILDHFQKELYGAQVETNLYILSKPNFMIFALRPSKAAPTKGILFSRFDHLDNYKNTNLIFKK